MALPLHISRPVTALMLGMVALTILVLDVRASEPETTEPDANIPAAAPCETGLAPLRFDDDIACFRDPANRHGFPDSFKFLPLDDSEDAYLSFGGEVRQRYEYTHNPAFGADRQDSRGVWMQRLTLHGDLHLGPNVRVFGQAYHSLEAGRAGGPSPVDENRFEFQNAFVEFSTGPGDLSAMARLGRQEIRFCSQRLVSVREGPNNRRNFDAARIALSLPGWQLDGVIGRPVVPAPGVLDDQTSDRQWFWGGYATATDLMPIGALDLYYLGFRDDAGRFVQGTDEEERHSLGARHFGADGPWDWNVEGVYQFGSFGSGDIRAWTLASDAGVTLDLPWQPRLGLSLNVASGDDDPTDGDLGTFNPLFPRGNYFSKAAVLGPRNFFNVEPTLEFSPAPGWTVGTIANFFWRLKTSDGVYTPSGQILRAPGGSSERHVGTGLSLSSSYDIAANLTVTGIYTRLFAGEFLRDTGPAEDIDFFEATLQYKF